MGLAAPAEMGCRELFGGLVLGMLGACATSGESLPASEPVGIECLAPPGGDAGVDGTGLGAAGVSLEARHVDLGGRYPEIILARSFDNSPAPGCNGGSLGYTSPAIELHVPPAELSLGAHEVSPASDGAGLLIAYSGSADYWASGGEVILDGYDPATGSVCGSFSATFASGESVSGGFRARAIAPGPPSSETCYPDDHDLVLGCRASGSGSGGLVMVLGAFALRRRRRR